MNNPVEIIAETRFDNWPPRGDESAQEYKRRLARVALTVLHLDGWRIVRTHHDGDMELDDDPDSPTYDQFVERADITEEWTPETDQ